MTGEISAKETGECTDLRITEPIVKQLQRARPPSLSSWMNEGSTSSWGGPVELWNPRTQKTVDQPSTTNCATSFVHYIST